MDADLIGTFRRCACGAPLDPIPRGRGGDSFEWAGTGLCPEAQADGVPCPTPSDACDRCGRARREAVPAARSHARG